MYHFYVKLKITQTVQKGPSMDLNILDILDVVLLLL